MHGMPDWHHLLSRVYYLLTLPRIGGLLSLPSGILWDWVDLHTLPYQHLWDYIWSYGFQLLPSLPIGTEQPVGSNAMLLAAQLFHVWH